MQVLLFVFVCKSCERKWLHRILSSLQCVCSVFAVCCSVLQCVAACCRIEGSRSDMIACACGGGDTGAGVAVCCSVLQRVAACCSVLQCVVVCCRVLQYVAECCKGDTVAGVPEMIQLLVLQCVHTHDTHAHCMHTHVCTYTCAHSDTPC